MIFIRDNEGKFTVVVDNQHYTLTPDHHNYKAAVDALRNDNPGRFVELVDEKQKVEKWIEESETSGDLVVGDGTITYLGQPVQNVIVDRIFDMIDDGFDAQPMIEFLRRVMNNPSKRSVDTLWKFLEESHIPIDENGYILAYKYVTPEFKDCHSKTFDNSPGSTVEVPRNSVDDDPQRTCSHGLHVGNFEYSGHHGTVVVCQIDPADVVCVPYETGYGKMRVCKYKVLKQIESGTAMVSTVATSENSEFIDEPEEVCDYCGMEDCCEECLNCYECGEYDCRCNEDDDLCGYDDSYDDTLDDEVDKDEFGFGIGE